MDVLRKRHFRFSTINETLFNIIFDQDLFNSDIVLISTIKSI